MTGKENRLLLGASICFTGVKSQCSSLSVPNTLHTFIPGIFTYFISENVLLHRNAGIGAGVPAGVDCGAVLLCRLQAAGPSPNRRSTAAPLSPERAMKCGLGLAGAGHGPRFHVEGAALPPEQCPVPLAPNPTHLSPQGAVCEGGRAVGFRLRRTVTSPGKGRTPCSAPRPVTRAGLSSRRVRGSPGVLPGTFPATAAVTSSQTSGCTPRALSPLKTPSPAGALHASSETCPWVAELRSSRADRRHPGNPSRPPASRPHLPRGPDRHAVPGGPGTSCCLGVRGLPRYGQASASGFLVWLTAEPPQKLAVIEAVTSPRFL